MKVGIHVSISGSISNAVDNALTLGCSAFQIFTRNPRGWKAKQLLTDDINNFREKLASSKIERSATVAHMPYLPNLSSPDHDPDSKSLNSLLEELKRCSQLGIPYLVTHLGSHKAAGDQKGIEKLVENFTKAVRNSPSDVMILLENTAGQKNSVGSDFEQLASIFFQLKPSKRFGICLDTCHAFAAGYDLRTEKSAKSTLEQFDKFVGIDHLKIIHLNDSQGEIGCHKDRHEHIGLGKIGETGLRYVVRFANSKKIPVILETPIDDRCDAFGNIKKVKEFAEL
ncbi:MAG: deoxyribonuclease IV [Nitrosopumilaceae archaeon]